METISLQGLTLHVKDVEASLEFYKKIPGVVVRVHRPGQFAMLQIGTGRLGLLRHGEGNFHLEIETDNLEKLHEELRQNGMEVKSRPSMKSWGEYDFLVIDPDGNMVEFGGEVHRQP